MSYQNVENKKNTMHFILLWVLEVLLFWAKDLKLSGLFCY